MGKRKLTPEFMAAIQRLINEKGIVNPNQLHKAISGTEHSLALSAIQRADFKYVEGEANTPPPRVRTENFAVFCQNLIDARNLRTVGALADQPEMLRGGHTYQTIKRMAVDRQIVFPQDSLIDTDLVRDLLCKFSPEELKVLSKSGQLRVLPGQSPVPLINFDGDTIRIGYFTDPHTGSVYYKEAFMDEMVKVFIREKVDRICITGDITHGHPPENRGEVFGILTHIGFEFQLDYAVSQLDKLPKTIDGKVVEKDIISGNHDRFFKRQNGADIVKATCKALNALGHKVNYLGHDEGDISLNGKATLKLWHGEDGSSYATSYRIQKLVEAFTGGEKPHALFAGHTHKQGYWFERMVHCVSGGALSTQSHFMRSKKLANHSGFHIIDITVNDQGIASFGVRWFPFYC